MANRNVVVSAGEKNMVTVAIGKDKNENIVKNEDSVKTEFRIILNSIMNKVKCLEGTKDF